MGDCPSLTFSLLAKVFAKGKMFWYLLKGKCFGTSESRPAAGEFQHFHAREIHFRGPYTGISCIKCDYYRVFTRRNMVYH